ncbi:pre-mRNA-splicing factor Slu7 [Contarinia nasturtii]|uniref:pre-mRNA-splicing factor Slu7 n=1 Tax=Contarinia nasturtii TaxID=265458 RepID=UPI0012D41FCE|nr:pre-mRNA-splicing factor Slu7 [Contarinia nasturtii]
MSLSSTPRVPVSQLLSDAANNEEEPKKKSREDWRKAKELEEARKAGTAPAAVDEEGRDINPHIPQYISNAPWYYNASGPTLKHQRPQDEKETGVSGINDWYHRGVNTSKVITKFRKGACDNCGAMTHKKKDCFERPRKIGAKYTGNVVAHDEFVQPNIVTDYDGKRDRWSGYDPAAHREIIEEYQKVEEAKQKLKAEKLKDPTNSESGGIDDDDDDDEEEDGDKYADGADMPGTKVDSKQRITVRNLRIREDTAKYLRNLDPNSAYYDPKTRSMRDNPNPQKDANELEFAGENFVRYSGDTNKHATAQLFAWEAHGKGVDVHLLAEPTKLEMLQQEYDKKKEEFKSKTKDTVLGRYGGEEHLQAPPKSLLLAQTEEYVEYSRTGKVLKGQEKQANRSRYEEDVYLNNHTSVFGSYWRDFAWGYKCCHSFVKNSYCVGENGKQTSTVAMPSTSYDHFERRSADESDNEHEDEEQSKRRDDDSDSSQSDESIEEQRSKKKKKKNKKKKKKKSRNKDKEKTDLEKALEAEEKNNAMATHLLEMDERKRPFNSMYEVKKPTDEEVEAYLMKRRRDEDPMAAFMDK